MFDFLRLYFIMIFLYKNGLFSESYTKTEEMINNGILGQETCNGETFKPICANGRDVVLITSATYGRMQVGKCITQEEVSGVLGQDPKYFGCFSNVLDIMHKKCSLKNSCEVKLPDDELRKSKPCFPGLMVYLKTDFRCINVIVQESNCRFFATEIPKYLSFSDPTNSTMCGTKLKPWNVEAPRGQKIKLTLENLNDPKDHPSNMDCQLELGHVFDRSLGITKNATLCGNGNVRFDKDIGILERYVDSNGYTSTGSIIELTLNSLTRKDRNVDRNGWMMLLKIEADGCLDIIPPEDTWLKRNNDDIVVGCYSSKQTWYLRCEAGKWNGVIGNCSLEKDSASDINSNTSDNDNYEKAAVTEEQQIILFVAICALGLVICLTIICIGAICIKKYTWKTGAAGIYSKQPSGQYLMNRQTLTTNQVKSFYNYPNDLTGDNSVAETAGRSEENKYFVLEADHAEQ